MTSLGQWKCPAKPDQVSSTSGSTMHRGSIAGDSDDKHVRNELLCFMFNNAHTSPADGMICCLCEFYKPAEIVTARETLWKEYEDLLKVGVKKPRRTQTPTDKDAIKPWVEDISVWVLFLVNGHLNELTVKFYAIDLGRVPPCPPEELNIFSLAARLKALEQKVDKNQKKAEDNAKSVENLAHEVSEQNTEWPKPSESKKPSNKTQSTLVPLGDEAASTLSSASQALLSASSEGAGSIQAAKPALYAERSHLYI